MGLTSISTNTNPFIGLNQLQPVDFYASTASLNTGFIPFANNEAETFDINGYLDYLAKISLTMPTLGDFQNNMSGLNTLNPFGSNLYGMLNNIDLLTFNLSSSSTTTSTQTGGSSVQSSNSSIADNQSDLKPGLFKGRLAGQEALVTRLCKKYGVSPALVASIIGLESGWGTSNLAMHNNFGGYRAAGDLGKNEKGFGYFSTIEKGLEAMIKNLAGYTRYKDVAKVDFNNLDSIGSHYCEGGLWASKVRNIYNTTTQRYLA